MFPQIIGADGRLVDGDEGTLALMVQGAEDGSMDPDMVVGAAAPIAHRVAQRRPASTAVQRYRTLAASRPAPRPMPVPYQPPPHAAPAPAMAVQVSPQAGVVNTPAGNLREVVQGLDSGPTLILAGATFDLTFNASMLFRPTRLMVGPSFAPLFVINDIKIASDSLFLSTGPVPAENFLPDAVGASALKRRTAQPGTPVTVSVANIDAVAHRFRGAIFGDAADAAAC